MNITIIDDSEDEQSQECFAVSISNTGVDNISLETAQATICITDDDGRHYNRNMSQSYNFEFCVCAPQV